MKIVLPFFLKEVFSLREDYAHLDPVKNQKGLGVKKSRNSATKKKCISYMSEKTVKIKAINGYLALPSYLQLLLSKHSL